MRNRVLAVVGAVAVAVSLAQLAVPAAEADTYSFSNATPVQPPDGASASSTISVAGVVGPATDVNVQLRGLSHGRPQELDIELTGPNGQTIALMGDACGTTAIPAPGITLTLDDEAAGPVPLSGCASGSFQPTNHPGSDAWEVPPTATTLAAFDGADPNGTWTLRVLDISPIGFSGGLSAGFALEIQTKDVTSPDTTVTKKPKDTSRSKAKIKFSASEPGSHFECKVDKRQFKPCASPLKLKNLDVGKHKVQVRAVDAAGNVDATPAKVKWKVLPPDND